MNGLARPWCDKIKILVSYLYFICCKMHSNIVLCSHSPGVWLYTSSSTSLGWSAALYRLSSSISTVIHSCTKDIHPSILNCIAYLKSGRGNNSSKSDFQVILLICFKNNINMSYSLCACVFQIIRKWRQKQCLLVTERSEIEPMSSTTLNQEYQRMETVSDPFSHFLFTRIFVALSCSDSISCICLVFSLNLCWWSLTV